jgi:hypothetical protein
MYRGILKEKEDKAAKHRAIRRHLEEKGARARAAERRAAAPPACFEVVAHVDYDATIMIPEDPTNTTHHSEGRVDPVDLATTPE